MVMHTKPCIFEQEILQQGSMAEDTRDILKDWLRHVLSAKDISATKLAASAGVSTSTLTRFLNDKNYTSTLSTPTIAKISAITGVAAPAQYNINGDARGFAEPELMRIEDSDTQPMLLPGGARPENNQGIWEINTDLLEADGYMPGDRVLVQLGTTPRSDDIVCAQVYDLDRGSAETVIRKYDSPYLVTSATGTKGRKPLVVDEQTVKIVGVVILQWRQRKITAA